jgi:hypothetical protein
MIPRLQKPLLLCLGALLALAPALTGYAHFIRYSGARPFVPIPDRFDLAALPDRTVPLFIADQRREVRLAPGDSFEGVVSQILAAARAWDSVDTSDLRVAFSGLATPGAQMPSPWIEVSFSEDIPPGIVAMGGPVSRGEPIQTAAGAFSPIQKAVVVLRSDLQTRPSHTERFFLTLVHEIGHALGLQHSWTGCAMATEITRGVTRARPLTEDDIAGLSVLYPAPSFGQRFGTITGTVTMSGQPVPLASVVAIAPNRNPISALTGPDGAYRMEGVPPGAWRLYAHALPPSLPGEQQPVNLELPWTPEGRLAPGPAFDTVFLGGSPFAPDSLIVVGGQVTEGANFAVQHRDRVTMHSVQTYSFFGQEAVKPGHFTASNGAGSLVLAGFGLLAGGAPAPGLSARILGAPAALPASALRPYPGSGSYMTVDVPAEAEAGPRHLVFQLDGETHVVPLAYHLTLQPPPAVTSVSAASERTAVVEGRGFGSATRILFDGAPAAVRAVEGDRLTVAVPAGAAGLRPVVTAENPDGQSSLFGGSSQPVRYTYESGDTPVLTFSPTALPAGVETLIEIAAAGGRLDELLFRGGFSNTGMQIRRVWVTAPDRAVALVSISPLAAPAVVSLSVANGLQLAASPQLFLIQPARQVGFVQGSALRSMSFVSGSVLSVPLANVGATPPGAAISATIGGQPAAVIDFQGGVATIRVPAGLTPGPAVLNVQAFGQPLLPSAIQIDPSPPSILTVQIQGGPLVSMTNQPRPGDVLLIQAVVPADLAAAGGVQWRAFSAALEHTVLGVTPSPHQPQMVTLVVILSPQTPVLLPTPLALAANGRTSPSVNLVVRP